jgi:acyl-CoA reductase-like NAD-dependent aldehyde dehydrogenase
MLEDRAEIFVGGRWRRPSESEPLELVSPHSGEVIGRCAAAGPADVQDAVEAARATFDDGCWSRQEPSERIHAIRRLVDLYGERRSEIAEMVSAEMGAPITFAQRAHVGMPWAMMRALVDVADRHQWSEHRPGAFGGEVIIDRRPVGVVAAVVPWNMPQFLIATKLLPALLAGCSVVLKPSPETPLDALLLAGLVEQAGVPSGVVSVIPGGALVGEQLVGHALVDKVSFTGSTATGLRVAGVCAANLTPAALELGGKSAAVALEDADPGEVADAVRIASLSNSGQLCNALTRILVPAPRQAEYVDALTQVMSSLRVGNPADPDTDLGPLVSERQQRRVWEGIEGGVREGATLAFGGLGRPADLDRGWYVRPTLFADADNDMEVARQEIFGPVLTVIPYVDEADAVRIANDSAYGLAGSVFTTDAERGLAFARQIRTGTFGINQAYSMDPAAPFGGVKASGYGRELGAEGLDAYTQSTSISVAVSANDDDHS